MYGKALILFIILCLLATWCFADDKEESKNLYTQGEQKYNAGDYDGAITDLEKSYELDSRNFKAQRLLVEAYDAKGKQLLENQAFDQALEIYKKAYKLWPDNTAIKSTYKGLEDGSIQKQYQKETSVTTAETASGEELSSTLEEAESTLEEVSTGIEKGQVTQENQETITALKKELEQQRALIAKMKNEFASVPATGVDQNLENQIELVQNLTNMYKELLTQSTEEKESKDLAAIMQEMQQYRTAIEEKGTPISIVILIAVGSSLALILLVILMLYFFARISRRRRLRRQAGEQRYPRSEGYYGLTTNEAAMARESKNGSLLLAYDQSQEEPQVSEKDSIAMYKDILTYENLKAMHKQMLSGNLQWQTIRGNIDILNKELRTEILRLVEMKMESGDLTSYDGILAILFPFLTEGDDYLRKKADIMAKKILKEKGGVDLETQPEVLMIEAEGKDTATLDSLDFSNTKLLIQLAQQIDTMIAKTNHSLNVAKYAKGIGLALGLDSSDLALLYKAGLVHDFGYFVFDKDIIKKIKNSRELTDKDFIQIKQHPNKGVEFFTNKNCQIPQKVKDAILYHHERNDGTGYPNGLKAPDIPDFAKIIAVADAFDAITSKRPHKQKLSFTSASIIMRDLGRKQFELKYIEALISFKQKVYGTEIK